MREETITLESGNEFLNVTILGHNGTSIIAKVNILNGYHAHPILKFALNEAKKLFVIEVTNGINFDYFSEIEKVKEELISAIEKLYKLELKNGSVKNI